ncbi:hypothetical protein IKF74_00845 [Candidatus Saccharibacteria bacterium]|nr:hypothetical protein [Candidatus Saccharibacteria bacterium]
MSKMSELSIELQENPVRSAPTETYKSALGPSPVDTWPNYWRLCLAAIDAAGDLASKDKLLMNFRDKAKAFNVRPVIEKYYGGDVTNLKVARNEAAKDFFKAIDNINWFARRNNLDQVSAMKLMGILEDEKNRGKFRHHIRRHLEDNHPPFELDELPDRDFRKSR